MMSKKADEYVINPAPIPAGMTTLEEDSERVEDWPNLFDETEEVGLTEEGGE